MAAYAIEMLTNSIGKQRVVVTDDHMVGTGNFDDLRGRY